jgi:hypothetical protein
MSNAQALLAHTKNAQVATVSVAPGGPFMAIVHAGDLIPSMWGYFSICIMGDAASSNDDHEHGY